MSPIHRGSNVTDRVPAREEVPIFTGIMGIGDSGQANFPWNNSAIRSRPTAGGLWIPGEARVGAEKLIAALDVGFADVLQQDAHGVTLIGLLQRFAESLDAADDGFLFLPPSTNHDFIADPKRSRVDLARDDRAPLGNAKDIFNHHTKERITAHWTPPCLRDNRNRESLQENLWRDLHGSINRSSGLHNVKATTGYFSFRVWISVIREVPRATMAGSQPCDDRLHMTSVSHACRLIRRAHS